MLPGATAATNNYILCEYLASHGYVVAAVGSQGVNRPDVSGDISGFEALLKDMEFLREHTSLKSFVDKKKVAIIGHSFGGMSATLYSCKNKVDAVINFDGSNFAIGWQNLFKSFEYAKPENMSAAYMYLMSDPPTDSGFNHETFFMNGLKEKAVLAKIKGFGHGDYMSYYAALEYFAGVIPPMFPKDDMNFIATGFKHVCYSSKAFLDIHVKKGKEISGNLMDGYFLQRAQADLAFNNGDFILVESK